MKLQSNQTLLLLVTLFIAAGAYWYFFSGTKEEPSLIPSVAESSAEQKFQLLVSQLQPISFNTALFSDPRFMSLVNLATPITPEASGRLDPFAPVSGVSGGL